MKKLLLILAVGFVAMAVRAQSDPGRVQNTNFVAPVQSVSGAMALFQPEFTPLTQTASAIAEAITPDIQALAGNLGNDPTRIFNYVHDQIRYVHYFGSKKGAELTLLERSGNDFDQCALLSALLQAAGYSPGYGFAIMEMPYDSTNHQDLHHWLGLSVTNTNWTTTLNYFGNFLGQRGFYVFYEFDTTNTLGFQHMWVTLNMGGTNYYLDPSFKVSEPVSGINLSSAMGLSSNTLMTAAGGTDTGNYVTGLNESSLRGQLQNCNSNLLSYLSNNIPNATVAQVIGGQQIVSSSGLPLSTSLTFPIYTNSTYPLLNWTNQPTNFMGTFSVSLGGTNQTWFTPQLEGQRLSLTFSSNGLAQLWLEDSNVLQTTNTGGGSTVNVVLSATHPYGGWNTSLNIPIDAGASAGFDRSSTNTYQTTNASYAIIYAFEANQAWLMERQQKLGAYLAAGYTNGSRQVTTEVLNVMGLGWMVQTELSEELLSQEWGQLPQNHHRFGRMAQEAGRGYYVDVYMQLDGTFPGTGYGTNDIQNNNQVFDVSSYIWSAMEHGIIEQLQNSNLVAASTVKMIQIANTNSQAVYLAYSGNWSSVESSLVDYSSTSLSTLSSLVSSGFILLLPQNGSNNVAGPGTWAGDGYVELGTINGSRTMGMIIGGGYNGGYVSDPDADPSPPVISDIDDNQPTYFDPQSPTLPLSGQTGADPVNLVDGSFEITSSDLSLGQTEPRGLNLTRYYSSARRNANLAGMAPGWLHSYYCNVLPTSAPQLALGGGTAQQMAPMIVTTCAALNLYNNITPDPKNWTVTALIAKWGIDQITGNAVSVNLGNDTLQFVKQPGGTYTPPENCTMTLIQTNSAYWLGERHGRTFKFGTNNLLTNIVDPYGQAMTFSYNSSNQVASVTDWTNRSLTFTYSGGNLASVADSTGRSVSYGYTNGNLTSFTDAAGQTSTYAYDTNHEVIATFDALNRLVITNAYDGFGHITTQLTQGNASKMWQVFASGYQTVEIDPAGGQQVFTYDNQSRLTSSQDALGNLTQMAYDGQDHVIQTVSPLGETNQFIYDGNNNLIETIDPLSFSNVFVFDANNNLIASTDARAYSSHFGYNAQFSLTGFTNGAGNAITNTFNSNGTLATHSDAGGTTSYGYDSYGQLNSVTYPGSLGSESFSNSPLGDVTNHTDVRGFVTAFAYNNRRQLTNTVAPTNLTTKVSYDPIGNVLTITDARNFTTSNTWNVTRHLLATTLPATPQGSPTVNSTYDSRDWLAELQNPLGNPLYYTNDAAHRLIATTDPLSRSTIVSYDNDSHQTNLTDAASDKTAQFWDHRGKLIKVIDAATNIVGRAYDGNGNLIYLTNRNGKVWQFQYDGANRLTNTISPLSHSVSEAYNNRGLVQSTTDPLSQTTSFGYDARARMTSKTDNLGVNDYQYDGNNNVTLLTNVGGSKLSWGYDAYNRVTACTNAAGYVIQYRYDANGNLTNLVYPGNLTVSYYYDSNNRLTNVTDWANRQTSFSYDLAGHLTGVTRPNNTFRSMAYDADGELTNIIDQATSGFPIAFHTLNFNLAGRVQWEFKGPLPHTNTPPTRTMTFDNDNRLATFNGSSVTIDADGNLTYGPLTNNTFGTYAYDPRNELTSAGGLSYGYDPAGNRTSMTNGSAVTAFVINPQGSQLLMRIKGTTTNYYIYGAGLLYEIDETPTSTNTAFYHFDCRGSTVALTDGNGNPTDAIEYSPYAVTTYRVGTNDTPFLYNGQFGVQTDPNSLLYMRARYYDPYICRFLNPDPNGFSGGLNFYLFCNGNPISATDPFGLGFWSVTGHFVEGVAIGAATTVVIVLAAPEIAAAGAAALTYAGVEAVTATTIASATVTAGVGATAIAGGIATGVNTYNNAVAGNWDAVAYNAGTLTGGSLVGINGGGQALAEGISGQPTAASPGLFGDNSLGYDPNYPNGSLLTWFGSGPTPQSGAAAATLTASGADLLLQPSGAPATQPSSWLPSSTLPVDSSLPSSTSPSSSTGK